ncbi:hypothetical protein [Streptomyces sp. NPDC017890]|uniref:hypothetical protein n=1 Tax=Streptomyces sp. NPDC017890 TaxID=3365015 RepID=UPI00379831B8
MSTTNTSEPRRQRRGRLSLPTPRRADRPSGVRGRSVVPVPPSDGSAVLNDRAERRLLRTASAMGGKAAKRGVLDPWVLQSGDRVPYFAELASVRDRVIGRIGEQAGLTEEQEKLQDARAESEVTKCTADTTLIDHRLREAEEQIATAKEQLDILARRTTRWNRFRDAIRARLEARWMEQTFPAVPSPRRADGGDGDGDGDGDGRQAQTPAAVPAQARQTRSEEEPDILQPVPRTGEAPRPADGDGEGGPAPARTSFTGARTVVGDVPADAWEGLAKRPGLPGWMTWATLLAIVLVEAPIYWAAFQPFHGVGSVDADTQTITLAAAAAFVMVLLPHLAGRMLRWRATTGAVRASWLPSLTLLGVWVALTVLFGVLRAKFVTQSEGETDLPPEAEGFAGADTGPTATLLDRLDLAPQTVTAMFCALLLLSGGIGFLLGLFREHPFLDAYRTALERRAALLRRREESVAATERARATQNTAEARREDRRQATEQRIRAVHALYDAAAAAYLNGLVSGSGDPAVTEAAMKLADTWPLLPTAGRH